MDKSRFVVAAIVVTIPLYGALCAAADTRQLGPTGLSGQTAATSIKVVQVAKGSPADGKLKAGDEIIGAGPARFKADVCRELAAAISR